MNWAPFLLLLALAVLVTAIGLGRPDQAPLAPAYSPAEAAKIPGEIVLSEHCPPSFEKTRRRALSPG